MGNSAQIGKRRKLSIRLRLSALACILLLFAASTAEVAHHHQGEFASAHTSSPTSQHLPAQNQKDTEARCPLCIAMHSALPVTVDLALAPLALAHQVVLPPHSFRYVSRWSFQLFSRPPPARA